MKRSCLEGDNEKSLTLDLPASSSTVIASLPKRAGEVQAWRISGIVQMLAENLLCGLDTDFL